MQKSLLIRNRFLSVGWPVATDWTASFGLKFEFACFLPVSAVTGPAYRYGRPAVAPDRSGEKPCHWVVLRTAKDLILL
jgi:hypothetical protein